MEIFGWDNQLRTTYMNESDLRTLNREPCNVGRPDVKFIGNLAED
jgi:hypothetical protein